MDFTGAGNEVELSMGMDVNTGTITLQAAIKGNIKMTGIIWQGKDKVLVSWILFRVVRNLLGLSSDKVEFMEH